ncbi:MAG: hypothetical protein IKE24_02240 [Clostridia bacterium]|nr:hypothetical protein [Clostridia bacterium]
MLKLMKYELRKTWFTKVILLALTAAAEIGFLIGLYGDRDEPMSVSVVILVLLATFGVLVIGLESILTLHRDMNTRQSYMLFMTPNSSYKILGAKVLECSISILLTGGFFFALGTLDISLVLSKTGELDRIWKMFKEMLAHITVNGRALQLDARTVGALVFQMLATWITTITTAYLADVISSALLNGKKFNGVISFLLFLALNWGLSWITDKITAPIPDMITMMFVYGGISLVFSAVMYVITAIIMEKRLSV